jgi:hypothetical protein
VTEAPRKIVMTPTADWTELAMVAGVQPLPFSSWAFAGYPGFDVCQRLLLEESAITEADLLLVEHTAIARLTAAEAAKLNLPPLTTLRAVIEGSGVMLRPEFSVKLRWTRPSGQNVLSVERIGAWLREPDGWRRLPETLFTVAQAVGDYALVPLGEEAARLRALAALREALPYAATAGTAEGSGMLGTVTILEADALSLETMGEGDAMQLVPVLHRAGPENLPLLPEDRARLFGRDQFHRWPTARPVYSLPGGVYITLSPPLRQALEVVRKAAAGSPAQRRALLRAPRRAIRAAIGDEADEAVLESLVIETPAWSERVIGLGLWERRVLPWITLGGNDWFGGAPSNPGASGSEPKGLLVDDQRLALSPGAAADLSTRVKSAIADGRTFVTEQTDRGPVEVPATQATLDALKSVAPKASKVDDPTTSPLVLIIKPNEMSHDIEALVQRRAAPAMGLPQCLRSTLKAHQHEGLAWLQKNWIAGSPGVLLADDMGLGKTLQGLAFLAWLREGMAAGTIANAPVLIVAPTGLLENWRAEHARHLYEPGLGNLVLAYGKGLAALRQVNADGTPGLDRAALTTADWVLTTYETLRDQDADFGQVGFAAILFDEAQKVKTPGIRITDAAKGMKADFRVAMTGTPVENRLADLWCIVDGVAMGHLGTLREFSATYEASPTQEKLAELKASLDRPFGGRPPLLLRRLKEDKLPDLPPRDDKVLFADMAPAQLEAYLEAVDMSRSDRGAGRVLQALQRLRAVSLHPDPEGAQDDATLIANSARLGLTMQVLDEIAARSERALVFVETQTLMARLVGLLQRRYRLSDPPMTISGKVAGPARQARVDRFQAAAGGFDVMLLSPKAGGVGLTLTRANHVVHLERWWNPAVEDQCTARVLRIGQERPVTVHIPLTKRPDGQRSFDENLHALLDRKRSLMRDALLPPELDSEELSAMLDVTLD